MTTKTFFIDAPFGKIPAIEYTPSILKSDVLVVFAHGRGENGNGKLDTADGLLKLLNNGNHKNLLDNAEKYGFRVLAPQYVPQLAGWSPGWTKEYTEVCIDHALTMTKLGKVGGTGLSQGGGFVVHALNNPKTAAKIFAAIAICPVPEYGGDFSLVAKYSIPVLDFHAKDDTTVNVTSSRNMVDKWNAYNPNPRVKYEELTSGNHYIWGTIYGRDEIYKWLLSYAPSQQPVPQPQPTEDKILYTIKTTVYESGKIISEKL